LPVNFTIDRTGLLINDGWKDKKPAWTPQRLEQIVTTSGVSKLKGR